ncbi:hypothetical protein C4F50_05335 [Flavobacterium sp. KB82]|uniref:Uncharacterized protein n=2 Tax=Flavobacterium hungaricum TaxID=2082725 RepID=A0ABR9TG85_9FLAO|nr:hypothetical protein [Flavobacterium hungaricum]
MIQLTKIERLSSFENPNQKVNLKYLGWEEPYRGFELFYYALFINGIDQTEALFSTNRLECRLDENIQIEHPTRNFAFIPSLEPVLLDTSNFTKIPLKVLFRENGTNYSDQLKGSFFYADYHLTINSRSLILTNLATLETNKIKFPADAAIEWAYFKNPSQIQIIEAYSNKGFIYNVESKEIIYQKSIVDEMLYPNIFRWIYRRQQYNSNEIEMELLQKKDNAFVSTYFKVS